MCERGEKKMWPSRLFIHDINERLHAAAGVIAALFNSWRKNECSRCFDLFKCDIWPFWRLSGVYLLTHMTHLWSLNQLVYGFEPGPMLVGWSSQSMTMSQ